MEDIPFARDNLSSLTAGDSQSRSSQVVYVLLVLLLVAGLGVGGYELYRYFRNKKGHTTKPDDKNN